MRHVKLTKLKLAIDMFLVLVGLVCSTVLAMTGYHGPGKKEEFSV